MNDLELKSIEEFVNLKFGKVRSIIENGEVFICSE